MKLFLLNREYRGEAELVLSADDYHYLVNVRRLRPGDEIPARDASNRALLLRVSAVNREQSEIRLSVESTGGERDGRMAAAAAESEQAGRSPAPREIILIQGLPKGKKTDQILRQAVEAGASRIILVKTEHSVPVLDRADFEKKSGRWKKILAEAVQQSANPALPVLELAGDLEELTGMLPAGAVKLFCHQTRLEQGNLHGLLRPAADDSRIPVAVFIGPEGGFSSKECDRLMNLSFHALFLGDTILRTETAGVYALGAVNTILREGKHWEHRL